MNKLMYAVYAIVVTIASASINSGLSSGTSGSSYRSWGTPGFSTGSGSSWGGSGHK